jgi:mannose-6-phosphate isomerase-like protein (cupin superfamily)
MEPGAARGFVLGPGEGESVWSLGGRFTIKAGGRNGSLALAIVESLAFRATEPPLHIHHREDEAWYVLDGQMTFHVGGEALVAGTGSFAFAPRGLPHSFTVDIEPTRVLVFTAPAGFERFAAELGQTATSDEQPVGLAMPAPEELGAVGERYGIEVVGPPIRILQAASDGQGRG